MYFHSSLIDATKYLKTSQLKHGLDEGFTMPALLAHYQGQPLVYSQGCTQEQKPFKMDGRRLENVDNDAPSITLVPEDCIYADMGC